MPGDPRRPAVQFGVADEAQEQQHQLTVYYLPAYGGAVIGGAVKGQ
jgi:hypothetical protein